MCREEILKLLFETPYEELQERAANVVAKEKGTHVFVRGLIEFSNTCRRNCYYCGLRSANKGLKRYTLAKDEILFMTEQAQEEGVDTIVLQSGEYHIDPMWLADIISSIAQNLHLPVTLSVGEQPQEAYALWKEAGAVRFLLKHETADARLYARLHPGHNLQERVDCLRVLKELGYEIGNGFMVGLPGQDPATLADDILLTKSLGVSMCGAGPFIPQRDTPLRSEAGGSIGLTLRVMAVLRLMLPWVNMPSTTALATADAVNGQKNGLLSGANVLMPSFTPSAYGEHYCIYDHKNRVNITCARQAIEAAGRTSRLVASPRSNRINTLYVYPEQGNNCPPSPMWVQPTDQPHSSTLGGRS